MLESKTIKQTLDDKLGLAAIYYRQGRLASRSKQFDKAETLLENALSIQTQLDDQVGLVRTLRLLTRVSILRKDLVSAARYCLDALKIAESIDDKNEQAYTLYTLSIIYYRQDKLEDAQDINGRCAALFNHIGNQKMQALTLLSLSGIQEKLGNLDESLNTCKQSEALLRALKDDFNLVFVLEHYCKVYIRKNLYDKALFYGREALAIAKIKNPTEKDIYTKFVATSILKQQNTVNV